MHGSASFEPEHRLGTEERFIGRAGSIDLRPFDVAEVEIFLLARNAVPASEASPLRLLTRAIRVSRPAVRNRPWNGTPFAEFAIAVRSAGSAKTASTMTEYPAAVTRRAFSASKV